MKAKTAKWILYPLLTLLVIAMGVPSFIPEWGGGWGIGFIVEGVLFGLVGLLWFIVHLATAIIEGD